MYNNKKESRQECFLMDDEKVKAVHDSDLASLLESLGELDNIQQGKQVCIYCHSVITLTNLEGIIPHEGNVVFSCNKNDCALRLLS